MRALPLPVSAPFHSSRCSSPRPIACAKNSREVEISEPKIPVIHNFNVLSHSTAAEIREVLASQASNPVRWVETVQKMAADGVTHAVEIGPGKVLQGLIKRIAPQIQALCRHRRRLARRPRWRRIK